MRPVEEVLHERVAEAVAETSRCICLQPACDWDEVYGYHGRCQACGRRRHILEEAQHITAALADLSGQL